MVSTLYRLCWVIVFFNKSISVSLDLPSQTSIAHWIAVSSILRHSYDSYERISHLYISSKILHLQDVFLKHVLLIYA